MDEKKLSEVNNEEGEIGEDEIHRHPTNGAHRLSHRRRQQNAIFDAWRQEQIKNTDLTVVKTSHRSNEHEEIQTINDMLKKQEGRKIIGSEYAFQLELFERAKQQNTIVVVDTGAGKTLVAMLLLKHVVELDIEARARGTSRKVAIFLVDKVTLMFQQYYALRANLPYEIESISGAHKPRLWSQGKWKDIFCTNDIVVCTADVLRHCLGRAFVKIEQLSLLIFDEAHHAKKSHAYARIMEKYDEPSTQPERPLIFGMTASPVDIQNSDDVEECASELEQILRAKIATCSDQDSEGRSAKPAEEVIVFAASPKRTESALYLSLREKYRDLSDFDSLFNVATEISSRLGPWCSDAFWKFAFSDKELNKYTARAERAASQKHVDDEQSRAKSDKQAADLHAAHEEIQVHKLADVTATLMDLSSKVLTLRGCLLRYFERPTDSRCLVFVERRAEARLLKTVFDELGEPYMKCGFLIGSATTDFEGERYTYRQQIHTIQQFRKGHLNCLFATSVAEEGLDIPECNLVIRFDPCKTMIQYVQSRGRARHRNSRFIHLMERDDYEAQDRLAEIHNCERIMKDFCLGLPRDQRLLADDDADEDSSAKNGKFPSYLIKSTGARLTYDLSLMILNHYVSMIPRDEDVDDMTTRFNVFVREEKFVCEVNLPERAKLSPVVGRAYSKKIHAKMSAAFEMCKILRKQGLLNENLMPVYVDTLHMMRGARLAIKSHRQRPHKIQLKPSMWQEDRGSMPKTLYLTGIRLGHGWDRPVRPIGLLTRRELPQLPSFPLFKLNGDLSTVLSHADSTAMSVDENLLSQFTWFTLSLFKDIYNKKFEEKPESMSYWMVPLLDDVNFPETMLSDPSRAIDMKLLQSMHGEDPLKWQPGMTNEDLVNKFLIDPWDGGRRFFSLSISPKLTPFEKIPPNVAPGPRGASNIVEYSTGLFRASKARRTWNEDQPVVYAEKVLHRLNTLATPNEQEQKSVTKCFLCPEPLDISRLPPDVAASGLLFPAIIHRFESYLIALEFCDTLKLTVQPHLALEATTKDSDNSGDAQAEKINFQRGMGPNYERLEFVGDTFLKMATSISTFIYNAGKDEYWMHVDRMTLLCNANMFNNAQRNNYPKYIRSREFSRRTWYPEGLKLLQGKGVKKTGEDNRLEQALSDKTVADVCEAVIGAALVSHVETGLEDLSCFDDAVRAVSEFVTNQELQAHTMKAWSDYSKAYSIPKYQTATCSASEIKVAHDIEKIHGYHFKHVKLLTSAFTHPSAGQGYAKAPTYQRLEFLGDALLDMTAVKHLFYKYPEKDPQWMTEHKMAMVSNKFMGALGAKLGFNRFLNHNSKAIRVQIPLFIEEYEESLRESRGSRNFWETLRDPPKCLADMVESYVGAMFIDSNFNFGEVQRFFDTHIKWFFEDMSIYDDFANSHPINKLRELLQTSMGCKDWRIMASEEHSDDEHTSVAIAGVLIHMTMVGEKGLAKTGRVAKIEAANNAYKEVHGLSPTEFRLRYGCCCAGVNGELPESVEDGEIENTAI